MLLTRLIEYFVGVLCSEMVGFGAFATVARSSVLVKGRFTFTHNAVVLPGNALKAWGLWPLGCLVPFDPNNVRKRPGKQFCIH